MSFRASYEGDKLDLFTTAWQKKPVNGVLVNFASALKYQAIAVYIQYGLVVLLLSTPAATRPETVGWSFFDYAFSSYYAYKYGPRQLCGPDHRFKQNLHIP
jgi:hypothetical protein